MPAASLEDWPMAELMPCDVGGEFHACGCDGYCPRSNMGRIVCHCTLQDHVLPQNQNLKSLSIREFASMVFDVCPGLDQYKVCFTSRD